MVQGPVDHDLTPFCIETIRRYLPEAEVILSTWEGSDLRGLKVDHLVLNADPGSVVCNIGARPISYNVNRQIVSSLNGIRTATRPFVVKVRSDMEFTGSGFLELPSRFPIRTDRMKVFQDRIVTCTVPSQSVRRRGLVLSPSDWFQFGRREDLLLLWDIPLDENAQTARYFASHPRPSPDRLRHFIYRYLPEQYIFLQCLKKVAPVELEHLGESTRELRKLTELLFANNYIMADEQSLGVHFRKYRHNASSRCGYMTFSEWQWLYRCYCDPNRRPPTFIKYFGEHLRLYAQLVWYRGTARLAGLWTSAD